MRGKRSRFIRIETSRLTLREWTLSDSDIKDMVEVLSDYDVAKNLSTPFPYTETDARQYIEKRISEPNTMRLMHYAIELQGKGKVIGGTSIALDSNNVATGGIWLNPEYHCKGYGTEIWRRRAALCFEELGAEFVSSGYLVGNEISRKMHEKIGFVPNGESEHNCPARGGKTKEYKMILTKANFYGKTCGVPQTHELKTLTEYYKSIKDGTKTFEVRFNDRDYKVGDILILKDYDGKTYSGDEMEMKITYVLNNPNFCKKGFVVLGIKEYK